MGADLVVKDLVKSFTNRETKRLDVALGPVNLEVEDGEFLCIVGLSGSGKSTLLNILSRLEKPTSGEVLFPNASNRKRPTSLVFQEFALFPWRTVLGNVKFGPEVRGTPKEESVEVSRKFLKIVGLEGVESKYPYELSGGMRQRVAIARALACDPEILLMDEPFASVDYQTRIMLQDELLRIWEATRKTVVFVTHNIEEAVLLGDRVVVLSRRPGTVKSIVPIDLPRPRSDEIRATARFASLCGVIQSQIKQEMSRSVEGHESKE